MPYLSFQTLGHKPALNGLLLTVACTLDEKMQGNCDATNMPPADSHVNGQKMAQAVKIRLIWGRYMAIVDDNTAFLLSLIHWTGESKFHSS